MTGAPVVRCVSCTRDLPVRRRVPPPRPCSRPRRRARRVSARCRWGSVRRAWRWAPRRTKYPRRGPRRCRGRARAAPCRRRPPGSWPVRRAGRARTRRQGVNDSRTTSRSIPARSAYSRAARSTPVTTASRVAWSAARESSQPRTREGMALTPLGSTAILPKVASAPVSPASRRAASTVSAYVTIGSRRSVSRVVPAWLASPGSRTASGRAARWRRRCRQGSPVRSRARPCSTWSSTNAPIRARRSGSGPMVPGSYPAASMAAGRVVPSASVRRWASATVSCPAASQGPDAGQSEAGALLVTEVGDGQRPGELHSPAVEFVERGEGGHHAERAVEGPAVRYGVQMGAGDDGVPGQGSPSQAHWLPLRSISYASPRASACARNQARQSRSAADQA